ncbi:MAG: UDP-N-acetylmuramate--alanine ligase, partial [Planctomycetes bacterium]|nr:UDP-N-acetylmuramate--alanine ligase [Planctomycetota bacterium]
MLQTRYHFVGIGGVGMSAIAQVLNGEGLLVTGSDRAHDQGGNRVVFSKLAAQGINLFPQNGSGVTPHTSFVVVSTAIEEDNPDIRAARRLTIPIVKRAELLAQLFNSKYGIAIGGTSGKTTVTGMVGWALDAAGLAPSVLNGGAILNYVSDTAIGNAKRGSSNIVCIEADESDGSIVHYRPKVAAVTNITKEHKTLDELFGLFGSFAKATSDLVVLNADDPTLARLTVEAQRVTFGITARADVKADDVELLATGSRFRVGERAYELSVPGAHNVSNALVAIAIARHLNADEAKVADGLRTFQGIARRLARVAEVNGVLVLDDYAHNPAEIAVAIAAARHGRRRVLAVYQPHGFGPTRFVRQELVDAFAASLTPSDALFMPEIYYAGGTADKSLS